MPAKSDIPVHARTASAVPLWKSLVLTAVFIAAAICIVKYNIIHGAILFCGAIFMQTYGGFSNAQAIAGETKRRTVIFVFAWVLLVLMASAAQQVFPPFKDVFASFGADLPLPTRLTMAYYPLVQVLPFAVALVWQFWPQRTSRLRAASIVCWSCIGLLVLMLCFMYLPIIKLGSVV